MKYWKRTTYLGQAVAACVLVASLPASAQSVSYSTPLFSATFCGSQVGLENTTTDTATETVYSAHTPTSTCTVEVRTVGHAIAVDYSSSDFYANHVDWTRTSDITRGYQDGHVYSQADYANPDHTSITRDRFIIVSPTEVITVKASVFTNGPLDSVFGAFANSLSVK